MCECFIFSVACVSQNFAPRFRRIANTEMKDVLAGSDYLGVNFDEEE